MQCWRCNCLLACGGSGKAGVYKLAESILSKLLTALEMEKADKAMFEGSPRVVQCSLSFTLVKDLLQCMLTAYSSTFAYGASNELYPRFLALHLPTLQNVCPSWGLVHHWSFFKRCCLSMNEVIYPPTSAQRIKD
ncbi:uncharacterized protein [Montipora foliosa]|uniref:uncharacterized protein n=1 Tax=Montipora foliosa TaxID=591990 RepID=UPI0035F15821